MKNEKHGCLSRNLPNFPVSDKVGISRVSRHYTANSTGGLEHCLTSLSELYTDQSAINKEIKCLLGEDNTFIMSLQMFSTESNKIRF